MPHKRTEIKMNVILIQYFKILRNVFIFCIVNVLKYTKAYINRKFHYKI